METMNTTVIIGTIDSAFYAMQMRKEFEVIVKQFSVNAIVLPKNTITSLNGFLLKLTIRNGKRYIVLEGEKQSVPIMFFEEGRKNVVETLIKNEILPTCEEFLEARSIANTPGVARMDYEDVITPDAVRYLAEKKRS